MNWCYLFTEVVDQNISMMSLPQLGQILDVMSVWRTVSVIIIVYHYNKNSAVPAEGNGDLQTLICVLVARPRQCLTLSNPVPWQNWMAAYLGYTPWMTTLFRGWPVCSWHAYEKKKKTARSTFYSRQTGVPSCRCYTLRMKTLFHGWPIMLNDTHTRRRRLSTLYKQFLLIGRLDCASILYVVALYLSRACISLIFMVLYTLNFLVRLSFSELSLVRLVLDWLD